MAWLHRGFVVIVVVYFQVDFCVCVWLLCTVRLMLYASLWSDVECGVRPGGRGEGGHSSGNRVCRKCQVFREQIPVCLQHLQQAAAGAQAVQAWVLWQLRLWGAFCRWPSQGLQGPRLPGGAWMWAGVVRGAGLAAKPAHEKSGCSGAGGSRGHVRVSQRQHQRHQQPQRPVRSRGPRLGERQRQIGHNFRRHRHRCSGSARGGKPKRLGSSQWEQTKQQPIRALLVRHVQSARCGRCSQHVARWSAARKGRGYRGRGRESIAGEWWTWGRSKPHCIIILSQRCRGCHSQVPTTGQKHTQGGWVPLSFLTECQVPTTGQKHTQGGWVPLSFLTECQVPTTGQKHTQGGWVPLSFLTECQVPTTGQKHTQGGWVPLSFLTECQVLTSGQKHTQGGWVPLSFLTECQVLTSGQKHTQGGWVPLSFLTECQVLTTGQKHTQGGWVPLSFLTECQVLTSGQKHTQGGWVPLSFLTECQVLTSGQKHTQGGWVPLSFLTECQVLTSGQKKHSRRVSEAQLFFLQNASAICLLWFVYNLLSLLRVFAFEIQVTFHEKVQFIWVTLTSGILAWCWWTGFVLMFPQVCFSCCHGFFEVCTHLMPLAALLRQCCYNSCCVIIAWKHRR